MAEDRKTLLESLKDTFEFYKKRNSVGLMKTDHVIFIPTELMVKESQETQAFIKLARYINEQKEWFCPIQAEENTIQGVAGVEFIFTFASETQFEKIIREIESRVYHYYQKTEG
jgi:hypothetical protein